LADPEQPGNLNLARDVACAVPRENLHRSAAFNPAWWLNESLARRREVGTEADDCKRFVGHGHQCLLEAPEHTLVRHWLKKHMVVMEFGARFGTTSCEIAKALGNTGALVSVEPDPTAWDSLDRNLMANNCRSHVVRGALSTQPVFIPSSTSYATNAGCKGDVRVPNYSFKEVEQALGRPIDTLLIDCEGCIDSMMDQLGPIIKTNINTIIVEQDGAAKYNEFFSILEADGFERVEELNDCDKEKTGAPPKVWCGSRLQHSVFQRRRR